jgi:chromosome segregation ATPase
MHVMSDQEWHGKFVASEKEVSRLTRELDKEKERLNDVVVEAKQYIHQCNQKLVASEETIKGLKKERRVHEKKIKDLQTTVNEYILTLETQEALIRNLQDRLHNTPVNESYKL